jgi:hypothetical protein
MPGRSSIVPLCSQLAGSSLLRLPICATPSVPTGPSAVTTTAVEPERTRAMIGTASLSFDHATEQVEDMVQQGTAFAQVEDVIDAAQLSDLHKAALWLLAWSLRKPSLQRQEARLMAGAFARNDEDQSGEQQSTRESSHGHLRSATRSISDATPVGANQSARSRRPTTTQGGVRRHSRRSLTSCTRECLDP